MDIIYRKTPPRDFPAIERDDFYVKYVLPEFKVNGMPEWERHLKTSPDSFAHIFSVGVTRYMLTFDDYLDEPRVFTSNFVRTLHCDGAQVVCIETSKGKYIENITGYFMLFQVLDDKAFDEYIDYLELVFWQQQKRWNSESKQVVVVARDILQLAETAARNKDWQSLHGVSNLVDALGILDAIDNDVELADLGRYVHSLDDTEIGYDIEVVDRVRAREKVYSQLSRDARHMVASMKHDARELGLTATLVSAMYARREADVTNGTSIAFVVDGGGIHYPTSHFLDDELQNFLAKDTLIDELNIQHHLPKHLGDYTLVEGSVSIRRVFRRELEYMGW